MSLAPGPSVDHCKDWLSDGNKEENRNYAPGVQQLVEVVGKEVRGTGKID